ncbi:unnamed protein product, partial [Rotaria sp. Silwood2]
TITVSLLTRPIPEQCLHGLNVFDLNNLLKPTPIPTKPGRWHKADTAFEDKNIQPKSPIYSISHVESTASIQKFDLFYSDRSKKNFAYYLKLAVSWICGVEHQGEDDDEAAVVPALPPLASENEFWKSICNINGGLIIAFCVFVWAFFTDYRIDKMYKST